jgi:hypothetical protein
MSRRGAEGAFDDLAPSGVDPWKNPLANRGGSAPSRAPAIGCGCFSLPLWVGAVDLTMDGQSVLYLLLGILVGVLGVAIVVRVIDALGGAPTRRRHRSVGYWIYLIVSGCAHCGAMIAMGVGAERLSPSMSGGVLLAYSATLTYAVWRFTVRRFDAERDGEHDPWERT